MRLTDKIFQPLLTNSMLVLLLVMFSGTAQAQLYRWVDENGQVQFGDRIPPQYSKNGHEVLSEDGRVLEQIEREKTKEEVAVIEAELARQEILRKQREEQARDDATLMRTFTSTEDIDRTLDQRVSSIQSQINRDQASIGSHEYDLRSSLRKKKNYQSRDEIVPHQLVLNISELRSRLRTLDDEIMKKKQMQLEIRSELTADKERFLELTNNNNTQANSNY